VELAEVMQSLCQRASGLHEAKSAALLTRATKVLQPHPQHEGSELGERLHCGLVAVEVVCEVTDEVTDSAKGQEKEEARHRGEEELAVLERPSKAQNGSVQEDNPCHQQKQSQRPQKQDK
jgi:hypothetical protein